jgi:hypothetical protein
VAGFGNRATKLQNRATKTSIWPENREIAPQNLESRHKVWNRARDVLKENTKMNTDDGRWTYRVCAA